VAERWVLVVDDEPAMGRMLVEGLRDAGWQARATGALGEALELLHRQRYVAVVSDVRMADGDGFDLLRSVRAIAAPVPVILMSSFGTQLTSRQALEAGAFGYLAKPFALGALLDLLERAQASPAARP